MSALVVTRLILRCSLYRWELAMTLHEFSDLEKAIPVKFMFERFSML